MFNIKAKDKSINFKITFRKANEFSMKHCKADESLMTLIPSKIMSNDSGVFLIEALHHFQVAEDGEMLSKNDIGEFVEQSMEEKGHLSVPELYSKLLEEFDYSGVFKEGMGFSMAKKINEVMDGMVKEMKKKEKEPITKK